MEKELFSIFEYQRFNKNERLQKLIDETEAHYRKVLSMGELELVNAAGNSSLVATIKQNNKNENL